MQVHECFLIPGRNPVCWASDSPQVASALNGAGVQLVRQQVLRTSGSCGLGTTPPWRAGHSGQTSCPSASGWWRLHRPHTHSHSTLKHFTHISLFSSPHNNPKERLPLFYRKETEADRLRHCQGHTVSKGSGTTMPPPAVETVPRLSQAGST